MFKDTDQELARLEAELLKVEEPDTQDQEDCEKEYDDSYEDEYDDSYAQDDDLYEEDDPSEAEEDLPEYYYQDTRAANGPAIYQNYSNDYGRNLRNFASGYQAYNTDDCDEDLDAYSEDVMDGEPERNNATVLAVACVLALAAAAAALFLLLRYRGIL